MRIRDTLRSGPLGFGAAPLGNMFRKVPDEEAVATVETAWRLGVRYFDCAPFYGAGLSEIRLGRELAKHDRADYVLSTKVGRIILDEVERDRRDLGEKSGLFEYGRPNRIAYDYSYDGALRSHEDSLKRLGVDHVDFLWVHDIARDFHGDDWTAQFEAARTGAFRALTRLRDEGAIQGWGLGVNRVEPVELTLALTDVRPDAMLLAGRYTLLDHEQALQRVMPMAAHQGVDIVVGGPYSSGVLAGGSHFEYAAATPDILARVERLKSVAERHRIPIKAAALQFSLAHPASAAVIPGASRPARVEEDAAALKTEIPDDFWRELRHERLVAADAPLPIDRQAKAHAAASVEVPAPPDQVWELIGGFDSLPAWLPYIPKSELAEGGRVRRLANPQGQTIVERLVNYDEAGHSYSYAILEAPFPVTDYRSTIHVEATDGGRRSRVDWSGEFRPKGVSDQEASHLFQGIYEQGLKALADGFASGAH
jgi:D-threo-aldose 1-dehydrogenase